MSKLKIGLALGGGGSRGICHVGVLKVLEEHGITPYAIAGTSMGAVVGGVYASGAKLEDIIKFADDVSNSKIMDLNMFKMYRDSLFKGKRARAGIQKLLKQKNIEDCKIKFFSISYDINSGKKVVFDKGDLMDAIYASMAVPALFRPLDKDGMRLVDGGIINNMPHEILKELGCDLIICVDPTGEYDGHLYKKNALSMLTNILNVVMRHQQELLCDKNNIIITPKLDGILNFNFSKENSNKAIQAGIEATREKIDEILCTIKKMEGKKNVRSVKNNKKCKKAQ